MNAVKRLFLMGIGVVLLGSLNGWAEDPIQASPTIRALESTSATIDFAVTFPSSMAGQDVTYQYQICRLNLFEPVPVSGSNSVCTATPVELTTIDATLKKRFTWSANDLSPNRVYSVWILFLPPISGGINRSVVLDFVPTFNTTPAAVERAPSNLPPDPTGSLFPRVTSMVGYWKDTLNPLGVRSGDACVTRYEFEVCPVGSATGCKVSTPCSSDHLDLPEDVRAFQSGSIDNGLQADTLYEGRVRVQNHAAGLPGIYYVANGPWTPLGQIRTAIGGSFNFISAAPDSGYPLDDQHVCVGRNSVYRFHFNHPVGNINLPKLHVWRHAYASGGQPTSLAVEWDRQGNDLIVGPVTGTPWPANDPIRIDIEPGAIDDHAGETNHESISRAFVAQPAIAQNPHLTSFYDGRDTITQVEFPSGQTDPNACLAFRTEFVNPHEASAAGVAFAGTQTDTLQPLSKKVEVVAVLNNTLVDQALQAPLLRMNLQDPQVAQDVQNAGGELTIAKLNPVTKKLQALPTTRRGDTLEAPIYASGVYFLAKSFASSSLSQLVVFPNPYKPTGTLTDGVHFRGLAAGSNIRLFTMAGHKVFETTVTSVGSDYVWPLRNQSNESVASGVYLYRIETATDKRSGKIIVIR